MAHRHRAITAKTETRPFFHCVAPYHCEPASHGNVVFRDYCHCGAMRDTAVNQRFRERASWQDVPKPPASILH